MNNVKMRAQFALVLCAIIPMVQARDRHNKKHLLGSLNTMMGISQEPIESEIPMVMTQVSNEARMPVAPTQEPMLLNDEPVIEGKQGVLEVPLAESPTVDAALFDQTVTGLESPDTIS